MISPLQPLNNLHDKARSKVLTMLKSVNNYLVLKQPEIDNSIKPLKFALAYHVVNRSIRSKMSSRFLKEFEGMDHSRLSEDDSVVVIATFIHEYYNYLETEGSLALLFRKRGIKSTIYYNDDRSFFHLFGEDNDKFHVDYTWKVTKKIHHFLQNKFPNFYVPYSSAQILADSEIWQIAGQMIDDDNFNYKGIDLRCHIDIGISRYYRSCPKMFHIEADCADVLLKNTYNAIKSILMAEHIISHSKPTSVVMSHAIYSFWGPMYDFFQANGVKTQIIRSSSGARKHSIYFHVRNIPMPEMNAILCDHDLDDVSFRTAKEVVSKIMDKRFSMNALDQKTVIDLKSNAEHEDSFLSKIDGLRQDGNKIFGMFPNLLYDYSFTTRYGAFPTITDWLVETIKYFESVGKMKLILKLHPVETNARLKPRINPLDVIRELIDKEPNDLKNVIIIHPADNISSYSLFPYLDGGVVYTGTLGLELSYKKIPIVNGTIDGPYTRYGFTKDPSSKDEYFKFFEDPAASLDFQLANYHKLINYIFLYLHVNQMPVSYQDNPLAAQLQDKTLNQIADFILDKTDHAFQNNIYKPAVRSFIDGS
jgi:hypothetical protein